MCAFCFSGQIAWRKRGTESLGSSPGLSRKIPTPETSHTAPVTVSIFCFCLFHAWCQRPLDCYVYWMLKVIMLLKSVFSVILSIQVSATISVMTESVQKKPLSVLCVHCFKIAKKFALCMNSVKFKFNGTNRRTEFILIILREKKCIKT